MHKIDCPVGSMPPDERRLLRLTLFDAVSDMNAAAADCAKYGDMESATLLREDARKLLRDLLSEAL